MKKQKLRYYLRGLGIGVLVTAFILGIAGKDETTLTDAQIRERALELGMVDADSIVLSELQSNDIQESDAEETIEAETESVEETVEAETESVEETIEAETESVEETVEAETESAEETVEAETESSEESVEPETEDAEATDEEAELETPQLVTITIRSGASSYSVSKDLAEAGLIEDVGAYDAYLCNNGYSRRIRIGTYEIEMGADEEEIAKIITGKR